MSSTLVKSKQEYAEYLDDECIKLSNALTRAAQMLSLNELRLIYLAVKKIPAGITAAQYLSNPSITITAAEFRARYGMTQDAAQKALKSSAKGLYERSVIWHLGDESETWTRWIWSRTKYQNGSVSIKFTPDILPHLLKLQSHFTLLELNYVGAFKSANTVRLYHILKSWQSYGGKTLFIEDLHHQLDSNATCIKDFGQFRRHVLESSIAEINGLTGLSVSYTPIKGAQGRVVKITFTVKTKANIAKAASRMPDMAGLTSDEEVILGEYKWGYGKFSDAPDRWVRDSHPDSAVQAARHSSAVLGRPVTEQDVFDAHMRYLKLMHETDKIRSNAAVSFVEG
ncbi:replication protein [Methylophilaceae bacterium]